MKTILEHGPELDAKVAAACGYEFTLHEYRGKNFVVRAEDTEIGSLPITWRPSTDLNAAFEAAEKCGLFVFGETEDDGSRFLDRVIDGGVVRWRVCQHKYNREDQGVSIAPVSFADTPALAICAAILSLAGEPK